MNKLLKLVTLLVLLTFIHSNVVSQDKNNIELSGTILEVGLPIAAITSSLIWNEKLDGTYQFINSMGTTVVLTEVLKRVINKTRPNGGEHSFPSGHTSAAFTGAAFLERRHGWKVGIPCYLLASYVGWTRIHANKHDVWDVVGGAILGISSSYFFTKPFQSKKLNFTISETQSYYCFNLKLTF